MNKQTVLWLAGAAVAALGAVCVWQARQIARLEVRGGVLSVPAAVSANAAQRASPRPAAADETARREARQPSPAPEAPADRPATNPPAARDAAAAASRPAAEAPMAGLAKMIRNPGLKDMLRAQQKAQLEITYGPLLKYLQLSDEDLETFKQLLLDKQMRLVDLSLEMMDGAAAAGSEERKRQLARLGEAAKEQDDRIKAFLGEDDFAVYREFEETQPERLHVKLFKETLAPEEALSDEQEHALILALHEERKKLPQAFMNRETPPDPATFDAASVSNRVALIGRWYESGLQRAAEILTPNQLAQYRRSLEQQRAMSEMGLKMAAQMFGARPSEPAQPPAP